VEHRGGQFGAAGVYYRRGAAATSDLLLPE
jgi:hypothetical protein